MPCPTCRDLSISGLKDNLKLEFDIRELLQSANAGCRFCKMLQAATTLDSESNQGDIIVRVESLYDNVYNRRLPLQIGVDCVFLYQYPVSGWLSDIYTSNVNIASAFPALTLEPHISIDSSSIRCLSLAKDWLDQCIRQHGNDTCLYETKRPLPNRVIAVGDDSTQPFLYESALDERGSYATLSYCWGDSRTFITTSSTLAQRKAGFELTELPKTLREAVVVARALSIPFLWIDALCIIQDSRTDWEIEASNMCTVYENSLLTIAAMDSMNGDGGVFLSSEGRKSKEISVDIGDGGIVFVRSTRNSAEKVGTVHVIQDYNIKTKDILLTRGWVLQELKISPRLLIFSHNELGWVCQSSGACECDPNLRRLDHDSPGMAPFAAVGRGRRSQGVESLLSNVSSDLINAWLGTVEDFTRRVLTIPTDRLPALSGLAEKYSSRIEARYMCGIWDASQNDLTCQLLWKRTPFFREDERLAGYAPSWSWASLRGEVGFLWWEDFPLRLLWKIEDIQFNPHGVNCYGPGSGSVTIEGPIVRIVPHWKSSDTKNVLQYYVDDEENHSKLLFTDEMKTDYFDEKPNCNQMIYQQYMFSAYKDAHPGSKPTSDEVFAENKLVFLFATLGEDDERFAGLLLAAVPGSTDSEFRRVGVIHQYFKWFSKDFKGWQDWKQTVEICKIRLI